MNIRHLLVSLTAIILAAALSQGAVTTYVIDSVHSGIGFKVRHHFTKVPGSFAKFSGEIHFDAEHPAQSSVTASIEADSIYTHNEKRDGHLRSEEFFKVDEYPALTFESTAWKALGNNQFEVTGNLTMVGVTKPVTLAVEFLGEGPGNRDSTISGWDVSGELDREEWGITYGRGIIGDTVAIEINLQAKKQ